MRGEIFESLGTDDAALEQLDMRRYLTAQVRHASVAVLLLKPLSRRRPIPAVYKVVNYLGSPWSTASLLMARVLLVCSKRFDAGRRSGMSRGPVCTLLVPLAAFSLP